MNNCLLCMLSMQCISYSSGLKTQLVLEMFSKCAQFKRQKTESLAIWPGLLEAWLVLTSVKYHGNLYILIPLNQRLALTRLRATGPWLVPRRELIHSGHAWVMFSADLWWRSWSFEQHAIKASAGQFVLVNNFLVLLYRKLKKKLRYSLVSLKFLSFKLANKMEFSFFERNFCADCRIENHLLRVSKAVSVLHFPLQARKLGEFLEKGNYWHLLLELPAKCMLAIPAEQLKIFFHRTYICPGLPASFLFLCTSFTLPNISNLFIHLKSTRNWGLLCLDKRTNELAMVV